MYMDEAKRVLDNPTIPVPCLPAGYQKLSLSPPLVDSMISQELSLVDPIPLEILIHESILDQPLVVESVDLTPLVVHQVFYVKIRSHPPHVPLVSSDSSDLEKYSSVHVVQEVTPPTPMMEV